MGKERRPAASLRTQVYDIIRSGLRRGEIGEGGAATERDLASELGTSRTPIREALALLVHDGLIVPTTKGFTLPTVTDADIAEVYELRRLLESHALKSSIDNFSRADLRALHKALDDQVAAHRSGDAAAFAAANMAFRGAWTSRILNRRIGQLIEDFDDHIIALRRLTLSDRATQQMVIDGLASVLSHLESGDAAGAASAMERHLTRAEEALKDALRRSSSE